MAFKKFLDVFHMPVTRSEVIPESKATQGVWGRFRSLGEFLTGGQSGRYSSKPSYDDLMNAESELGRTLFGPVPEGRRREFFKSHGDVWIWHESATGAAGEMTIRYEVRSDGVYKKPTGGSYEKLVGKELENFVKAVRGYSKLVGGKLYS